MKFRVGREALGEAVAWVARALTSRPVVPVLSGLMLQADGDGLMLSCFDYEVSARMRIDADVVEAGAAMVPARTLADVTRTMAPGAGVTVAFGAGQAGAGAAPGAGPAGGARAGKDPRPADGMISFDAGNRRLTARLIGGEFIRYRSRFPAEFGSRALLPAGPFTEAVRRVSLVAERASPVRPAFGSGTVAIQAPTDRRALAAEPVPPTLPGP